MRGAGERPSCSVWLGMYSEFIIHCPRLVAVAFQWAKPYPPTLSSVRAPSPCPPSRSRHIYLTESAAVTVFATHAFSDKYIRAWLRTLFCTSSCIVLQPLETTLPRRGPTSCYACPLLPIWPPFCFCWCFRTEQRSSTC